ncbi:DUF1990 domain-containing protein [Kineosporia sp. NBRC 101731]|uniref:DUF1990 family protein n=1 Tax=Kineosporia sp. NBRC 101731 TaxID=3032199 RepID=UPI0024A38260|nr:DUF1990 domain-containing protein [Kineosporia sp. NBRC 101731]GLY28635.1 hypothetical protein Kisp02_20000 [Kineosporia sp. NBRC 101731]
MFALRPDFARTLTDAENSSPDESAGWLDHPPATADRVSHSIRLPGALADYGQALLDWEVHRGAGLRVTASGPAAVGATVVLGYRIGPVWALIPCRVTALEQTEQVVAFTYATLPGHPESGAERFGFVADDDGVRFEVSAVSRPAFWGSRLVPAVSRRVQRQVTDQYLEAARRLARP